MSERGHGKPETTDVQPNREDAPIKFAFHTSLANLSYGLGCSLLVLAFLDLAVTVIAAMVLQRPVSTLMTTFSMLSSLAAGVCAVGLISEVSFKIASKSSLLSKPWVKHAVKILGIPIAFAALADARLMINHLTGGVDPEQFTFGLSALTTMLTVWYVAHVWFVGTLFLLSGGFLALFFKAALSSEGPGLREWLSVLVGYLFRLRTGNYRLTHLRSSFKERARSRMTIFGRMAGVIGVLMILQYMTTAHVPEYVSDQVPKVITTVLVRSGYQPSSIECSNYKQGEWVAPVGYDRVSVAMPDAELGYRFETRPCNSNAAPG